ncbi:probable LRR receptor-like serine/threonine-protein kinase At1g53440 [Papaver somniferum]|uniref:probable LRR receptor-like serine/threonine-protein kinase At1g53440 n=1 Tax=Papaver somniferum TaxID=3469 RepID=UPI000E70478B|nr:probable LRR receptor-like serine/threonine-protein kinase At1g53440 [Papaver somniferum]
MRLSPSRGVILQKFKKLLKKCFLWICRQLRRLNLIGELPDEFADFPYLQEIDLNHNYLSGSVPKAWKTLPLVNLAMLANTIGGSIPKEIAEIVTLQHLVLTDNQLEGPLPPELGKLTSLTQLALSGNNFTGVLPATFANLKNMADFRIAGTSISGKIPDFIGDWTQLIELDIRGTSMEGPIPSTIFHLKNLTKLRVSDLRGPETPFPDFQDVSVMSQLELRNCLIRGSIPSNIGEMIPRLIRLDLSFNRLTGDIHSLQEIPHLKYLYLTNNQLTGQVPLWITNTKQNFDLSYNNFTGPSLSSCQESHLNKMSSYPSDEDRIAWCLKKDLPCGTKSKYYSFFINSGGSEVAIGDEKYDADVSPMGPSSFHSYNDKWACSTTGDFIVPLPEGKANYLTQASPNMTVAELYKTARISPLSLKYYGICLRPGNYKVKLHFAEIMFPTDKTAAGIGTRKFDVSIQGKRYLKAFNIEEEAKGVGRSITKEYDVDVTSSTLEIHLYWAGKGTIFIPSDFAYGPLISAIAVTPNFGPDTSHVSVGVIAGIVAASFVLIVLVLAILWKKGYLGKKDLEDKELGELLQTSYFTLREVKAATRNFDRANKIGEGGFGPVYKGLRPDGSLIAVKQLSSMSKQGNREFVNEIGIISGLQHPNLVKLFGCCVEGNQLLVIYEYMENNSLARALYGRADQRLNLDWPTRFRICMDIAKGLAFLHEESRLKIVHRDIKTTNVLLDKDLTAKISDFGMAKLDEEENTHISTRIVGTLGYMAPEYASSGRLTYKADIYSFGIVALEIVSGKSNTSYMTNDECFCLLDWANVLKEQGNLLDLIDPILKPNYSKKEVLRMLNIALLCTNRSPTLRPMMSTVLGMLKGRLPVQESLAVCSPRTDDSRSSASSEGISYDSQIHVSTSSQGGTLLEMTNSSSEDPWQADSTISTYYSMKKKKKLEDTEVKWLNSP